MAPRVLVSRTTPATTIPALTADAMLLSVVTKITETYKKHNFPTTSEAITADLQKTFSSVSLTSFGPEYLWEKNPITCLYHIVCREGSTITVNDGANGPVLVTIYDESQVA